VSASRWASSDWWPVLTRAYPMTDIGEASQKSAVPQRQTRRLSY